MIYNRTTWENSPSTSTPINAQNLNKIEQGITDAANEINAISHIVNVGTEVEEDYRVNFIHSRNLWKQLPNTQTLNGITLTNNGNGTFNLSGTATANTSLYVELDLGSTNLKNGTYTLSKKSAGYNIQLDFYNGTTYVSTPIYCYGSTLENSATLSIGSNVNKIRYIIYVANGSSVSLTNEEIMLNSGSEALPYEPYTTNSINVDGETFSETIKIGNEVDDKSRVNFIHSRNLFDDNTMIELTNQCRRYSDGAIVDVSNFYGIKVPIKPNTTYIISSNLTRDAISNLCYFNGNTYLSGVAFSSGALSFTTPNNCNYITLAIRIGYTWFQLEEGTTATPYKPFTTNEINIDNETFTDTIKVSNEVDSRSRVNVLKSKNLLDLSLLGMLVNPSGTVISNNNYWNVIIDTRKISSLYVSGNFSLLADNTIRIGTYSTYPTIGSTGTRVTLQANGVINTSDANYVLFCFGLASGSVVVTIDQVKASFMINEGSEALPYEPFIPNQIVVDNEKYTDTLKVGTDVDGRSRVNVLKSNNLFDLDYYYNNCTTNNCTKEKTTTGIKLSFTAGRDAFVGWAGKSDFTLSDEAKRILIPVKPNTNYTLSLSTSTRNSTYITYVTSDYSIINSSYQPISNKYTWTFTTPANCKYIVLRFGLSDSSITTYTFADIMINEGSTALPYEPYVVPSINVDGEEIYSKVSNSSGLDAFIATTDTSISSASFVELTNSSRSFKTVKENSTVICFVRLGGITNNSNSYDVLFKMQMDNSQETSVKQTNRSDWGANWTSTNDRITLTDMFVFTNVPAGNHTFKMLWSSADNNTTATIGRYARYSVTFVEI